MRELDITAVALSVRVAEAEAELRATYDELRARREAEAINRERARLMRDLHDGIGGELASMLALADAPAPRTQEIARSEEHTSELQSLMRTSYAVFCLKKKKKPARMTKEKK